MNHASIILLLLIMPLPSSPTIAGLYLIGRDGLNNTLNSAIAVPKQFLRGYNDGNDPTSRAILDAAVASMDVLQRLMNLILRVVFIPLNMIVYPVDLVVEGILNMIPLVRRVAQLLDRVIFGVNDSQGAALELLSDTSHRLGQKLNRHAPPTESSPVTEARVEGAPARNTLTVFIGNKSVEINDDGVLSMYNMFVACGESSIATLPELIENAKTMNTSVEIIVEPTLADAHSNLSTCLQDLAKMIDSMVTPDTRVTGSLKLFKKDVQKLLPNLSSTANAGMAKDISRAITSSVLLLNDLVAAGVDNESLNGFYIQVITGLVNTVGAVSLKIALSTESDGELRNFLQTALKPLNIGKSITEVCKKL